MVFIHAVIFHPLPLPHNVVTELKTWLYSWVLMQGISISYDDIRVTSTTVSSLPFLTLPSIIFYYMHHPDTTVFFSRKTLELAVTQFLVCLQPSHEASLFHCIAFFGKHPRITCATTTISSFLPILDSTPPKIYTAKQYPFLLDMPDTILHHIFRHVPSHTSAARATCSRLSAALLDTEEETFTFSASSWPQGGPSYNGMLRHTGNKTLSLHNPFNSSHVSQWIQNIPSFPNLTTLDMTGTPLIDATFLAHVNIEALTTILLVDCHLQPKCTRFLDEFFSRTTTLRHLSLASNSNLADTYFATFLGHVLKQDTPYLPNLMALDLRAIGLDDDSVKVFAKRAQCNTTLTHLDLAHNSIITTPYFPTGLQSLSLGWNHLDSETLATFQQLPNLTALDLRHNIDLLDVYHEILLHIPTLKSFNAVQLHLPDNASKLVLPYKCLYFHDVFSILNHPKSNPNILRHLDLSNNTIGHSSADSARQVFPLLQNIVYLDLSHNCIVYPMTKILVKEFPSTLTTLKIAGNNLGVHGISSFAPLISRLICLDIASTHMGDKGLYYLNLATGSMLTSLNIRDNALTDKAIPTIHKHIFACHTCLQNLDMSNNHFNTPPSNDPRVHWDLCCGYATLQVDIHSFAAFLGQQIFHFNTTSALLLSLRRIAKNSESITQEQYCNQDLSSTDLQHFLMPSQHPKNVPSLCTPQQAQICISRWFRHSVQCKRLTKHIFAAFQAFITDHQQLTDSRAFFVRIIYLCWRKFSFLTAYSTTPNPDAIFTKALLSAYKFHDIERDMLLHPFQVNGVQLQNALKNTRIAAETMVTEIYCFLFDHDDPRSQQNTLRKLPHCMHAYITSLRQLRAVHQHYHDLYNTKIQTHKNDLQQPQDQDSREYEEYTRKLMILHKMQETHHQHAETFQWMPV